MLTMSGFGFVASGVESSSGARTLAGICSKSRGYETACSEHWRSLFRFGVSG